MGKSPTPPAEPSPSPEELGRQLRQAREACQLSIPAASAYLHLPPRVVEALEAGEFARFAPVYARGYLRNYARLLHLDADPLVEAYNRTLPPDAPPAPPKDAGTPGGKSTLSLLLPLAVVMLPVALWIGGKALRLLEEAAPPPVAEAGPPGGEPPAPAAVAAAPPAPPPQAAAEEPPKPPAAEAPAPADFVGPPSPAPAEQTATPTPDRVTVRLSAAAWVSISERGGGRLVHEKIPPGAERTYTGQAPFTVVLGNAPATRIEFNGQAFAPPKPKTGTAARFTLPP